MPVLGPVYMVYSGERMDFEVYELIGKHTHTGRQPMLSLCPPRRVRARVQVAESQTSIVASIVPIKSQPFETSKQYTLVVSPRSIFSSEAKEAVLHTSKVDDAQLTILSRSGTAQVTPVSLRLESS